LNWTRSKSGKQDRGGCAPLVLDLLPFGQSLIATHCPLPLGGRGRRPEAGRGGGYRQNIIVETGEGQAPLEDQRSSHAHFRSHLAPNGAQARYARTPHPSGVRAPGVPPVARPVSPSSHLRCSNSAPRRPPVFSNSCPTDSRSPERRSPKGDIRHGPLHGFCFLPAVSANDAPPWRLKFCSYGNVVPQDI
jgi:hypothetical protein